jgi:hypothetical protein
VLTLTVALAASALAACADEGDPDDGPPGGGRSGEATADLDTIAGALGALPPADDEAVQVAWGDLARAAEIADVTRPTDTGDERAVIDYVNAVTGGARVAGAEGAVPVAALAPEAAHVERTPRLDEVVDDVGWTILDVDRFVERQTVPEVVTVIGGDIDEDRLDAAMGEPTDGTWVAGDPDGGVDLAGATAARPLGEPLWITLAGDDLVVTRQVDATPAVRRALGVPTDADASAGATGAVGTAVLADDPDLVAVADALDAEDAYSALLVRPGLSLTPLLGPGAEAPGAFEQACEAGLDADTTAVATGIADDDGPVLLIALAHPSRDDAEANAAAVERVATEGRDVMGDRPWSDRVTFESAEVTGDDGTVVIARLRPVEAIGARLWYELLVRRDTLVSSC